MTTYPLPTLACTIDATGISAPGYADIYASLVASYQAIYGTDTVLTPDTQDGQWIAIQASAQNDSNNATIAAYNAYSPATAQGAGLSSIVKINGLQREVSSNSQADVTIVGQAGTLINNGIVGDNLNLGTQWALPSLVAVPIGGSITETVTCTTPGNTAAAPGVLTNILTPTRGWQTVTNPGAATPGNPVEVDAQLRVRQSISTGLPALSVMDSIIADVANLPGVSRYAGYENDTGSPDGNGIPAHSISLVVQGGDAVQIATAIALVKTPGTGTYGSTSEVIIDPKGVPNTINFYELDVVQLDVVVDITPLTGYVSTTKPLIQAAIVQYLNGLSIGEDSYYGRLWSPANLSGDVAVAGVAVYLAAQLPPQPALTQSQLDALSATYDITAVTQAIHSGSQTPATVDIAFNEAAGGTTSNITVTVA